MRVLLLYPPQQTFYGPHLGLPSLAAHLRRAGVDVVLRDLNVEINRLLLTPAWLRRAARRATTRHAGLATPPERVAWAGREADRVAEQLPAALGELADWGAARDDTRMLAAFGVLSEAYAVLSAGWHPTELSYGLSMRHDLASWEGLERAVADDAENPFGEALQPVIPSLLEPEPDLVGVGVTYEDQLVGALTLARMLRRARPELPLVLGGALVSRLGPALRRRGSLPKPFDFAVVHEGESALLALTEALAAGRPPAATIPNLLAHDPACGLRQGPPGVEQVATLATPDFRGLPLDDYLLPEPVLPLLTSRGCYWGRCAFCAHHLPYGDGGRFRNRPPDALEADLRTLADRHTSRTIYLVDEAVPARNLRHVARVNRKHGLGLAWFGDVRLEPTLTPECLRDLAAGGCRLLIYGLESGSQRVLDRMRKGIDAANSQQILRAAHEAGIANVVMAFVGFPGETVQDAQQTARWLQECRPWLHAAGIGSFSLLQGSPAHQAPEAYGISWVAEAPERGELGHTHAYRLRAGLDGASASRIADSVRRRLDSEAPPAAAFPRELIALRRGRQEAGGAAPRPTAAAPAAEAASTDARTEDT